MATSLSFLTGIVFDTPQSNKTCSDLADPDIAGIGVVTSFVIGALATTAASVAAAWLDAALLDEKSFFSQPLQRRLNDGRDPKDMLPQKRWRSTLDTLILSLADQQLVTGLALMVGGYAKQSKNLQGAHFTLIVYMCFLASSSHLAGIITLRKYLEEHRLTSILRISLVIGFAIMLLVSIAVSGAFGPFLFAIGTIESLLAIGYLADLSPPFEKVTTYSPIIWLFWTAVLEVMPSLKSEVRSLIRGSIWPFCRRRLFLGIPLDLLRKRLSSAVDQTLRKYIVKLFWLLLFLTPGIIFVLQILLALLSTGMTLAQKFAKPTSSDQGVCTLRSPDEDAWGFGQLLPMLLLWLPVLSAIESYVERHDDDRRKAQAVKPANLGSTTTVPSPSPVTTPASNSQSDLGANQSGDIGMTILSSIHQATSSSGSRRSSYELQASAEPGAGRFISHQRKADTEMGGRGHFRTDDSDRIGMSSRNDSVGVGATTSSQVDHIEPMSRHNTLHSENGHQA